MQPRFKIRVNKVEPSESEQNETSESISIKHRPRNFRINAINEGSGPGTESTRQDTTQRLFQSGNASQEASNSVCVAADDKQTGNPQKIKIKLPRSIQRAFQAQDANNATPTPNNIFAPNPNTKENTYPHKFRIKLGSLFPPSDVNNDSNLSQQSPGEHSDMRPSSKKQDPDHFENHVEARSFYASSSRDQDNANPSQPMGRGTNPQSVQNTNQNRPQNFPFPVRAKHHDQPHKIRIKLGSIIPPSSHAYQDTSQLSPERNNTNLDVNEENAIRNLREDPTKHSDTNSTELEPNQAATSALKNSSKIEKTNASQSQNLHRDYSDSQKNQQPIRDPNTAATLESTNLTNNSSRDPRFDSMDSTNSTISVAAQYPNSLQNEANTDALFQEIEDPNNPSSGSNKDSKNSPYSTNKDPNNSFYESGQDSNNPVVDGGKYENNRNNPLSGSSKSSKNPLYGEKKDINGSPSGSRNDPNNPFYDMGKDQDNERTNGNEPTDQFQTIFPSRDEWKNSPNLQEDATKAPFYVFNRSGAGMVDDFSNTQPALTQSSAQDQGTNPHIFQNPSQWRSSHFYDPRISQHHHSSNLNNFGSNTFQQHEPQNPLRGVPRPSSGGFVAGQSPLYPQTEHRKQLQQRPFPETRASPSQPYQNNICYDPINRTYREMTMNSVPPQNMCRDQFQNDKSSTSNNKENTENEIPNQTAKQEPQPVCQEKQQSHQDSLHFIPSMDSNDNFQGFRPNPGKVFQPSKIAFEFASNPDFVLVWNDAADKQISEDAKTKRYIFEYNLEEEGLCLEWGKYESLHATKVWAPLEVLVTYAEILEIKLHLKPSLQLSPNLIRTNSEHDDCSCFKKLWEKIHNLTALDPTLFPERERKFAEVYSRYKQYLFDLNESNIYENFAPTTRSRIVQYILKKTAFKMGEELDADVYAYGYEQLIKDKVYEAGYAIHDGTLDDKHSVRKLLYDHWGKYSFCLKSQPLDKIQEYFGEEFALYFAWVGFYTNMLLYASILGVACSIFGGVSVSFDVYVKNICDEKQNIIMCPSCDGNCPYWYIKDECDDSQIGHIFDNDVTFIFAVMMSIWSSLFLIYWKRRIACITHKWNLSDFDMKVDTTPRPNYVAALKKRYPKGIIYNKTKRLKSRIEGKKLKADALVDFTIPFWGMKVPCRIVTNIAILFLIAIALAAYVGVIVYRLWLSWFLTKRYAIRAEHCFAWQKIIVSLTAALINTAVILLFSLVYKKLAYKLCEMEYHRTQSGFETSLRIKVFVLQAVNNYSALCYMAFFKGSFSGTPEKYNRLFGELRQEECGTSCIPDLCIQLGILTIGREIGKNIRKIIIPWIKQKMRKTKNARRLRKSSQDNDVHDQWAKDFDLLDCGPSFLNEEYLDMVLQFGFIAPFVAAFPLAPLVILIANIFNIRANAKALLKHYRRPVGRRVKDIGVWYNYIDGIVQVAILSNAVIIGCTSNFIPRLLYRYNTIDTGIKHKTGTLDGYLNFTLTAFATKDLEYPPDQSALSHTNITTDICYYPTHKHEHDSDPDNKYKYKIHYYQIWLVRVLFVILYENVVVAFSQVIKWLVPSTPAKLRLKMRRDKLLQHELIEMTEVEIAKDQKLLPVKHSRLKTPQT